MIYKTTTTVQFLRAPQPYNTGVEFSVYGETSEQAMDRAERAMMAYPFRIKSFKMDTQEVDV